MQQILHFAQDSDTSGYFPQLAKWHDRQRYRMIFATLNPMADWLREYMLSQGVECFSCDCQQRSAYPLGLLKLAHYLRRKNVDILHTHLFEPSVIGLLAGALAGTKMRIVTRHYSDYHTRINRRWHVQLDQLCTRLSHGVIAVSQHTADHMLAEEQAPPEKLHVVLNGIDFARVRLSSDYDRSKVRQEFVDDETPLLLIAARLHPEKGYEYLFQAMTQLKQRCNGKIKLLVAGAGPFLHNYQEIVRSLGCDDVVTFLGFRKDLPDLMAAADLFVLPSVAEAFGLVLAEALYLGTPVVATQVGGIPEIVDAGLDGMLVPPANAPALADAIAALLNDFTRRKQMSGVGRDKVLSKFRFEDMVRSYEAIYRQLNGNGLEEVNAGSLGRHSHV
ncbi:MAG: glycosyltransferase [Acidobacteria bacterium]|nr:glycosyltransferase [Acidobacteriota bacterium]